MPENNPAAYGMLDSILGRRQGRGYPEDMSGQDALLELLEQQFPVEQPDAGMQVARGVASGPHKSFGKFSEGSDYDVISADEPVGQRRAEINRRINAGTIANPQSQQEFYKRGAVEPTPGRVSNRDRQILRQIFLPMIQ